MSNSVVEPTIAPIKVGDPVTINCPGWGHHGKQAKVIRLKVEQKYGQQLRLADLTIPGVKRTLEAQVSWLTIDNRPYKSGNGIEPRCL